MRVKIEVEFDVEPAGGQDSLDEQDAKDAAAYAARHFLALTEENRYVAKQVKVHLDGFGRCVVKIPK